MVESVAFLDMVVMRYMRSVRWRGFLRSSDSGLAIPGRGKKPDYLPDCPAALPRITMDLTHGCLYGYGLSGYGYGL